jgi:RNA polymerase sigma-70 factor (ECF subfamily)
MEPRTDADVIASSVTDGRRFGELFERHFELIYRYVARRLGPDDATDVAGEVFATAFRRRAAYDTSRPEALPWLYGIATRLVSHHRHSERRRLLLLTRSPDPGAWDGGYDDADERLDAERLVPAAVEALLMLSPGDRDALLLYAWADLTYEQVAVSLKIPVGTVRSRLNRARSMLKTALEDHISTDNKEVENG